MTQFAGPDSSTTPAPGALVPVKPRGGIQNLKRYPKGTKPPQLLSGPPRGPTKRDLMQLIQASLRAKNYAKLQELADSIIEGAIQREPACLALLGPRLAPLEQGATGGKIISEGIRLEVVDGKASVTLLKQTGEGVQVEGESVSMSDALPSLEESRGGRSCSVPLGSCSTSSGSPSPLGEEG